MESEQYFPSVFSDESYIRVQLVVWAELFSTDDQIKGNLWEYNHKIEVIMQSQPDDDEKTDPAPTYCDVKIRDVIEFAFSKIPTVVS